MFSHRERHGRAEFAVTDARSDLRTGDPAALERLSGAFAGLPIALMHQVHGVEIAPADPAATPTADALLVEGPGVVAAVRVADCVPIVLADDRLPLGAVVHAGRSGTAEGIVPATIARLRSEGAASLRAWIGPHVCGRCYEVPAALAAEVEGRVPGSSSTTSWGTPSIDLGAAVTSQLSAEQVTITDLGTCTLEDERFHSYRRDGDRAGRFAMLLTMHEEDE
ncbi:hypothetical protein BHE97_10835 [Aeromicrobium sp. PE09-221]|uniref:polyphenol oxidase family protein n=1 Tax=Aeromicrobium sp. PE09-221 TaxID=1898043 RepID=UPI000B6D68C4|nr:polyphenol oxidase family protein [Aeromicrobium sp. PE09-221]OUZ09535.1 hypothetical protein BHE97_10835 [Aeromicrobium sp. PE09-221]